MPHSHVVTFTIVVLPLGALPLLKKPLVKLMIHIHMFTRSLLLTTPVTIPPELDDAGFHYVSVVGKEASVRTDKGIDDVSEHAQSVRIQIRQQGNSRAGRKRTNALQRR